MTVIFLTHTQLRMAKALNAKKEVIERSVAFYGKILKLRIFIINASHIERVFQITKTITIP